MGIFKKYGDANRREIRPDEPEKTGVLLYFELFKRKFWNYVKLNLLYFATSIISIAIYWVALAALIVPVLLSPISDETWKVLSDASGGMPLEQVQGSVIFTISCVGALLMVVLFGGGVCTAGYNYVLRNYVRQENAFLVSDFFEHTKKNFLQALIITIVDLIIVSTCLFSAASYYSMMKTQPEDMMPVFAFAIMLFALFIYANMHTYLWTIIVTFDISIWKAYKNSFFLTFAAAIRSVGFIVLTVAFCAGMVTLFSYFWIAGVGLFVLIAMSAFNLAGHIFSYPIIKKYMIDNNN